MIRRLAVALSARAGQRRACGGDDDGAATPRCRRRRQPVRDADRRRAPTASRPSETSLTSTPRAVVEGLEVPWGIAFLPDGSALIAERDVAAIQQLTADGKISQVGEVDGVAPTSEGGLLGLAVSPSYDADQTIYAYFTTAEDNRVVSMTFAGRQARQRRRRSSTGIPRGEIHDGGRIAFGPDGKLYVTTGETGNGELAQDPDSLGGKILRLEPDGSIPNRQPRPEVAGVDTRSPQRPGHHLGRRRPDVGQRVRPERPGTSST